MIYVPWNVVVTCRECGAPLERLDENTWDSSCGHGAHLNEAAVLNVRFKDDEGAR